MGEIEEGVRFTLAKLGIESPSSFLEVQAITLARTWDDGLEEKNVAGISRELRIVMDEIKLDHPGNYNDQVDRLVNKPRVLMGN